MLTLQDKKKLIEMLSKNYQCNERNFIKAIAKDEEEETELTLKAFSLIDVENEDIDVKNEEKEQDKETHPIAVDVYVIKDTESFSKAFPWNGAFIKVLLDSFGRIRIPTDTEESWEMWKKRLSLYKDLSKDAGIQYKHIYDYEQ